MKRDAARTRQRIFDAAVVEFSAKGFAGARMDKIADRAQINKRLIYLYWGNKQQLYAAILSEKVSGLHEIFAGAAGPPGHRLVRYFEGARKDPSLVRLSEWEALTLKRTIMAGDERREAFRANVETVAKDQEDGLVTQAIEAKYLLLVFMALTGFPIAFPQNVRMITGLDWTDPAFQEGWRQCLTAVGRLLEASPSPT
jgi:TetR/AcrR family transcriptional regulator